MVMRVPVSGISDHYHHSNKIRIYLTNTCNNSLQKFYADTQKPRGQANMSHKAHKTASEQTECDNRKPFLTTIDKINVC